MRPEVAHLEYQPFCVYFEHVTCVVHAASSLSLSLKVARVVCDPSVVRTSGADPKVYTSSGAADEIRRFLLFK